MTRVGLSWACGHGQHALDEHDRDTKHVNGKVMTLGYAYRLCAMAYLYEYCSLLIPAEFLTNALCAKSGSMSTPDR